MEMPGLVEAISVTDIERLKSCDLTSSSEHPASCSSGGGGQVHCLS